MSDFGFNEFEFKKVLKYKTNFTKPTEPYPVFGETSIHASGEMKCSKCGKRLEELGLNEFSIDCYCDSNRTTIYTCKECMTHKNRRKRNNGKD